MVMDKLIMKVTDVLVVKNKTSYLQLLIHLLIYHIIYSVEFVKMMTSS